MATVYRSAETPVTNRVVAPVVPELVSGFLYPFRIDSQLREQVLLFRQLASLIGAGIGVGQALGNLHERSNSYRLKPVLVEAIAGTEKGEPFSAALRKHPDQFGGLQIELIAAGESGGLLAESLIEVANLLEAELRFRQRLSRQTAYAKVVFVSGALVIPTVFGFIFGGNPVQTILSFFVGLLNLGLVIGLVSAVERTILNRSLSARLVYERIKYSLPSTGKVSRRFVFGRFAHTFGVLHRAGLTVSTALSAAADATGSSLLREKIRSVVDNVERGASISDSLYVTGLFPPHVIEMMYTGEKTGELDSMAIKASEQLLHDAEEGAAKASYFVAQAFFLLIAITLFGGLGGFVRLLLPL